MNVSSIVLALAAVAFGGSLQAQTDFLPNAPAAKQEGVKYVLLTPSDKTSEVVKASDRNPFAKVNDGGGPNQKSLNEENRIRERLEKLRVVGVSPGNVGLRVMLGDIILEAGQQVPPLLPDQTVALKVGNITAQAIELLWLESRAAGLPQRKLTIPVDLRPYVRYKLKGIANDKNQWEKTKKEEETPVGRVFPDVSDAAHMAALKAAQNRMAQSPLPPALATGQTPLAELPMGAVEAALRQPAANGETPVTTEAPK